MMFEITGFFCEFDYIGKRGKVGFVRDSGKFEIAVFDVAGVDCTPTQQENIPTPCKYVHHVKLQGLSSNSPCTKWDLKSVPTDQSTDVSKKDFYIVLISKLQKQPGRVMSFSHMATRLAVFTRQYWLFCFQGSYSLTSWLISVNWLFSVNDLDVCRYDRVSMTRVIDIQSLIPTEHQNGEENHKHSKTKKAFHLTLIRVEQSLISTELEDSEGNRKHKWNIITTEALRQTLIREVRQNSLWSVQNFSTGTRKIQYIVKYDCSFVSVPKKPFWRLRARLIWLKFVFSIRNFAILATLPICLFTIWKARPGARAPLLL